MQHDLFSSLDSLLSVPAGAGGFLVRDLTGQYRPAEADEVLLAAQRLLGSKVRGSDVMSSPAVVREFLKLRLGQLPHEVFAVVHLDAQNRVIDYVEMFRGSVSQTSVYPREVVRDALLRNTSALLLVHNHPSGAAEPSRADEALTQTIKAAAALVDVRVLDHFIVTNASVRSMAEMGLVWGRGFGPFFCLINVLRASVEEGATGPAMPAVRSQRPAPVSRDRGLASFPPCGNEPAERTDRRPAPAAALWSRSVGQLVPLVTRHARRRAAVNTADREPLM